MLFVVTSRAAYDLIPLGSVGWKYVIATQEVSAPISAWRARTYDDTTGWTTGQTPIGYPSPVDRVGYENSIATTIRASSTTPTWNGVFFRKTFTVTNLSEVGGLLLNIYVDDGAVAWINGVEVGRINVASGTLAFDALATVAEEERLLQTNVTDVSMLVQGNNVLAIHGLNATNTSSDFHVEVFLRTVDDVPPTVGAIDPPNGAIVPALTFINVVFSEGVSGVNASDLLINGAPATSIVTNNPNDYTFYFPQPPTGAVSVAFAASHGIADTDGAPTPFEGLSWSYTLDPNAITEQFIISEIMPDNENGIEDEDGATSDWIEIYNPGFDANLQGWYLTDVKGSNMWRFPNTPLGANQYLIVWASGKGRTNNPARLHTNFELRQNGEYLALLDPQGNVVSAFDPFYPRVETDKSYGRDRVDPSLVGFFDVPTPGRQNTSSGSNFAPEPVFSLNDGVFTNDSIVVSITIPGGIGEIRYTTDGTEPTNNSPLYVGPLTFTTNVFIKARVYVSTPGIWPSKVVAKTYFLLDASARNFSSNLPILIINTAGRGLVQNVIGGGARTRGALVVLDTFRGRASLRDDPNYIGMAQFEIYGQTSAGFTKQPFNIELNDAYGNDIARSLLGLPSEADWKTRNPWSDKCLMNDFLAYELYEDMGNYSVRRRNVELFVCAPTSAGPNTTKVTYPGSYYGVLCFLEKIERDRDRVDIEELTPAHTTEPDIAGGYIIKKDKDSAGDRNFTVNGGAGHAAQLLKMHEPKPREVTTAQVNWILNYCNMMAGAMFATDWLTRTGTNHYSHYIDVDSWVDQHWIVEFPKQIDGYRISNFMSKKRFGKLTMSPVWDWNLAFGNANYLEGGRTNGWYWNIQQEGMDSGNHIWLRRLLYGVPTIVGTGGAAAQTPAVINSGDPDFIQKVIDRWGVLRTNVFNGDRVIGRIDEIAAQLAEAAGRNYQKYPILTQPQWPEPDGTGVWNVNYANQPTYAAIISEMKKWTRGRFNWIDSQFVRAPLLNRASGAVPAGENVTISAPSGGTLYYTLNGTDPRLPGGNVAPGAQTYTGPIIINNNVQVFARSRIGTNQYSWSPPAIVSLFTATPGLRITEIMYHPAEHGTSFSDEDFEYLELRNTSAGSLNIAGYKIRGGIDFLFPNITLNAGQRVLVVKNRAAFSALYITNGMIIAGEFINPPGGANNLDNTGERLVLEGNLGEPILDFRYDDDWYKVTDGLGFSLVIADDTLPTTAWADGANWRVGGQVDGTPGAGEPAPATFPQVVISEALTHTDLPAVDTIELHNLGSSSADISNWYLSDDRLDVKKFRLPNPTVIPAGEYITFDENQFNADPNNGFALSSTGDEVYLASANAAGELTGYLTGFSFGPQMNGVTFGRYVTSLMQDRFVSQVSGTLNGPNSGPLIGDVVLSEVNYHPPAVFANGAYWNNSEDEFIELYNRGSSAVNLYHPSDSNVVWKLDKAVEFDFPPGTSIPAGGYIVLVNFNPNTKPAMEQAFRTKFNVPAQVRVLGPLQGDLSNDDETVALYQPDTPFTNQNNVVEVPYVLVEEVQYSDELPWGLAADGAGFSLHRRAPVQYSDDPINWESSSPTPGRGYTPGTGPTISAHPQSVTVIESNAVTLTVSAAGPGPFRYQWRKAGANLEGKVGPSLDFLPATLNDAGDYQVLVMNNAGYVASSNATLRVLRVLRIEQSPVSLTVRPPTNVTFTVVASSSTPIRYQWFFNNNPLLGQTNSTLIINNVTNVHDGDYYVICADEIGPVTSSPAHLTVLINPIMLTPSPAAPLQLSAVVGENLTVSAELHGTLPIFARWRLTRNSGGTLSGTAFGPGGDSVNNQHFATASRVVAATDSGRVLLSLTNASGGSLAASGIVTNAFLTVLADFDLDGIPDVYEDANGMDKTDPNDITGDLDHDTSKNKDEYIAGTDPRDPTSYLKVDRIETIGSAVLHFIAVSNRSYSVQYLDELSVGGVWQGLANFGARPTNWNATATDPASPAKRFYRLVTPAQIAAP
jgi:CotH protein/lamin tail-like protein/Fn3 domain-containing protein/Ig-like domain-containing protein/chitobiase/beta-hexosaminidase-like protein